MSRWEYKVIKYPLKGFMTMSFNAEDFDDELNQYGNAGWELVNCFTVESGGYTKELVAVLKKEKGI